MRVAPSLLLTSLLGSLLASLLVACVDAKGAAQPSWPEIQRRREATVARCHHGRVSDCAFAGDLLAAELRYDEARLAYRRGCEGGDHQSCTRAIERGDRAMVAQACEAFSESCPEFARSLAPTDPRLTAAVVRSCKYADGPCIHLLLDLASRGGRVPELVQHICARTQQRAACSSIALQLEEEPALGPALARVACQSGDGSACLRLARAATGSADAAAMVRRACSLGSAEACDSRTRAALVVACRANQHEACRELGRAIAND